MTLYREADSNITFISVATVVSSAAAAVSAAAAEVTVPIMEGKAVEVTLLIVTEGAER